MLSVSHTADIGPSRFRPTLIALPIAVAALGIVETARVGWRQSALFAVGLAIGFVLHKTRLGFTAAYRALVLRGEVAGLRAQVLMVATATLLFAPVLATGQAFGLSMQGAVAPVGVPVVVGAVLFGIGMQLGGGCGSGTLLSLGGGSARMAITLIMFCIGGFWASLDWPFWERLPAMDAIVLGERLGWPAAALFQAGALLAGWLWLRRWDRSPPPQMAKGPGFWRRGHWSATSGALLLALLSFATLLLSGGPWSITWGFTLVAAKAATALGWQSPSYPFWQDDLQRTALEMPLVDDVVAVMDVAIIAGAMIAATIAGRFAPTLRLSPRTIAASVIGGLMLGYGARISFGCNIGAFFSGTASTSVHGWVWFFAAMAGTWVGVRLRPIFGFRSSDGLISGRHTR